MNRASSQYFTRCFLLLPTMSIKQIRILLFTCLFTTGSMSAFSQSTQWEVENKKSRIEKIFVIDGKSASDLYRSVNHWLSATFKNPETVLRSRVENEFIKGESIQMIKINSSDAALRYSFRIDIKEAKVRVIFSDATITYSMAHDSDESYSLASMINQRDKYSKSVVSAVTAASDSMLQSLENFLSNDPSTKSDW
jgi:hypothetical protein